ncbi:hypothetical protein ANT_29940 [Candidatus Vecturithrix granuli]|uniref:Uncharacterized protein n=1 Tax=Vecturithrix granuli TaxID=1499967 RepID=A0A081C6E8_VECG1|nr:hypothetical protein ANT_29940 [Candidatus Vecturithrix granuli]
MSVDQVSSAVFIGREQELAQFQGLLTPESPVAIFNIHTHGEGGVGKTKLLLRMQAYCASVPEQVVFAREIVDFYHTESRSRLGLMQQIVNNLGLEHFPEYRIILTRYFKATDASAREECLTQLEAAFQQDYAEFAATSATQQKIIVLFFDTYEVIQRIETGDDGYQRITTTGFSQWIETELFPALSQHTRLIVSGRYPLTAVDPGQLPLETLPLAHFTLTDTETFWKQCLHVRQEGELTKKITPDLLQTIHALADGRPVLLALFADWLNYARNPLSPEKLLAEIEERTGQLLSSITQAHKQLFEKALIERIASFQSPEEQAVMYLAVAYQRMTPDMFHFLTDLPLQVCRDILLRRLRTLSFIKYKKGDIVLLHDEMRRLVVRHWWEEQDAARDDRRAIARDLVRYYQERLLTQAQLSETDRETYTSELLEYALLADPQQGLIRFCQEFDIALEDGRYDYCDLLLREAETYLQEHPRDLPFPDFLELVLRRIRYYTKTDRNYGKSLQRATMILETYRNFPDWENSAVRGHILMEQAIAQFSLGKFAEAIQSFEQSRRIFYLVGEDSSIHWANNWIGYTYYRQGNFSEAEAYLARARDEFQDILDESGQFDARERRQLLQGIQAVLGNIAMVYSHTGQFDKAIRNAEIALSIVRHLPYNTVEIARTRNTVGQVFAFAGHAIDARHHLTEAEKLLHGLTNRQIAGRVKTNLGFLQYRVNEFAYLLEYYRAEDLEKIITYIPHERIDAARELLEYAIEMLSRAPVIKKELADAYYALGEVCMVTPGEDRWEQAENAFLQSLKWGQESQFQYRVVDTLESLVTLYYFWNGASDVTDDMKADNQEKMRRYQQEIEEFKDHRYPNLFGKYHVTSGDIAFDEALDMLRSDDAGEMLDAANLLLKEAFDHYTAAAVLMRKFNETRYYLILRVFYNRLNTLLNASRNQQIVSSVFHFLDVQRGEWQAQISAFEQIFYYVALRIQSEETQRAHLDELLQTIQPYLNQGNFGLVLLLNDCLIGICLSLRMYDSANDAYIEQLVLRLSVQAKLYRILGDEYQARRYLRLTRRRLREIADPYLKEALEGWIDVSEGTLKYRRGEYGKLVEFYLADELDTARKKFDAEFPGERQDALELLQHGEEKLRKILTYWEKQFEITTDPAMQQQLQAWLSTYHKCLGEAHFRIGELFMLHERFRDHSYQKRVFRHFKQAIEYVTAGQDFYRRDDAMQSYVNALYFSGNYDNPDYLDERVEYERLLEEKVSSQQMFPSIMAKLRITQGDALFSAYFQRKEAENDYHYVPRQSTPDIRTLRTILRYYAEACNFMAQHGSIDFAIAVRVLQRRIELIADQEALKEIRRGLRNIWTDQPYLREKTDILDTLVQFAKVRSMLLTDKTDG